MYNNKVSIFLLLVVFIIIIVPISASAHSGRTDSNGGHRDRSTGTYHYHHGHPAHQHPNGICPYSKKTDNTESTEITHSDVKDENNDTKSYGIKDVALMLSIPILIVIFAVLISKEKSGQSDVQSNAPLTNHRPLITQPTTPLVEKCDMCEKEGTQLFFVKIQNDLGTQYMKICGECFGKCDCILVSKTEYSSNTSSPKKS